MECNIDKCLKCSKKNQCSKYPVLQVLNSNQTIENKINVLSSITMNILDNMDTIIESIEELKNHDTEQAKQGFLSKFSSKQYKESK